jgi:hypothetical protein
MPAPKGNKFWLNRTKHGRDKLFSSAEVLWDACCEYFEWVEDNPLYEAKLVSYQGESTIEQVPKMRAMTIGGLCLFLGISKTTWDIYRKNEDFVVVTSEAEEIIRSQKFSGAAADLLNANIIARDLGLVDKKENDHRSSDGSMSPKSVDSEVVSKLVDKLID